MAAATIVAARAPDPARHRRAVRAWLWLVALLVFAMVVLGGATRLTQSGLSIVEWKPVTGALPPFSETQWQAEFEKYKAIPQYEAFNKGMSLGEFKIIYWWEWSHRQLGRLIGLAFALPLAAFWLLGWLEPRMKPRLLALLALGGTQGALGWWMVASGLAERTDVSQYRLAMHMTLACVIFAAIVWTARGLGETPRDEAPAAAWRVLAYLLVPLVLLQIFLGGLVAGLDAGLSHNTWPLMDGHVLPPYADLYVMRPLWANHFENALTVQFQHRMLAYLICGLVLWQAVALNWAGPAAAARRASLLALLVFTQAGIGIATLLLVVPLWAALLHQAVAVALLAVATVNARVVADSSPAVVTQPAALRP
jgi:cytochrome c oxidase assembly protein subunit 15